MFLRICKTFKSAKNGSENRNLQSLKTLGKPIANPQNVKFLEDPLTLTNSVSKFAVVELILGRPTFGIYDAKYIEFHL